MRFLTAALLASFAAGATALQFCADLPADPVLLGSIAAGVLLVVLYGLQRQRSAGRVANHAVVDVATPVTTAAFIAIVIAATALLGYAYAARRAELRLAVALPPEWEERDIRLVGVVDDLPHVTSAGTRFALEVEHVETVGAIVPHRVSLGWFAPRAQDAGVPQLPEIHAGERWALTVRLKRPHATVNPGGFDLEAWLLEHDLRATGSVRGDASNARIGAFAGRPGDYVERAREAVRARVAAALPDAAYAGVLTALAIGDQRAIPETQWRVFNRTGITHLVSISGLHVTVFATLAGAAALLCVRRSAALTLHVPARKLAAVVGSAFAIGYVLLAGAEVPAVRTLLMLLVAAAGLWLGRPGSAALVWLWSLFVVLAVDPWAALAPGFWLSFGAVGLLLYAGCGRISAAAPGSLLARLGESVREGAHAQWIVTLGLVPGTLALFQQVSLVSALANAIAIPVVTLCVVPLALLGIVVPGAWPWTIAHAVFAVLMRALEWLSALPMATWTSHAPPAWTVATAVLGSAWLFAPRGVPGRGWGLVWALPMMLVVPLPPAPGAARITVLDVGQGLAVVVATARHVLVYDAGPRWNDTVDAGSRIVFPFLRAAGVTHVDALVVSHADTDHSGGALSLMQSMPVTDLLSSLPADHPIAAQARRRMPERRCLAGDRWTWDGVEFAILHPSQDAYDDARRKSNDLSCVLHIRTAGGSVLLTGDIEARSEVQLLAGGDALNADVLVVPHHGSLTSSTGEFIAAVAPRVAIIAAGYRNRFGHPRAAVLARYARAGATLPRTDLEGAITVDIEPGTPIRPVGERDRHRRYWYDAAAARRQPT